MTAPGTMYQVFPAQVKSFRDGPHPIDFQLGIAHSSFIIFILTSYYIAYIGYLL